MLPVIEKLLVVQDRDRKIRAIQSELKAAPSQRRMLEEKIKSAQAEFESVKLKGQQVEVERKKLELDADSKRASIARFKTQQAQTRKNEEFQALAGEIARYERDISAIEDSELELMESYESAKAETATASKSLQDTEALARKQISDLEHKTATIQARLEELSLERTQLASQIDEEILSLYDRILRSKGDAAVVAVEHEVCMGCHMKVTTQTAHKVRAGKEMECCGNCGRILYEGE